MGFAPWYVILVVWSYHGTGITHIPAPNEEICNNIVEQLQDKFKFYNQGYSAFCIKAE